MHHSPGSVIAHSDGGAPPMRIRAARPAAIARRYGAYLAVGAAVASAIVASLPSLGIQLTVIGATAASTAGILLARIGRVLNPAWIVVIGIYLIGPIGTVLVGAGLGVSTAVVLTLAPSPFAVTALIQHRELGRRLVLLLPVLGLMLLAVVSLLWSAAPAYGVDKLTTFLLTSFLPILFILLLVPETPRIGWIFIAAAAFLSAVALLVFGANTDLYPGRLVIFGANPIWEARAAFIGVLAVIFGPFPLVVRLVTVPVMVVAGLVTVSLGPALGLLAGIWAGAGETLRRADRNDRRVGLGWAIFGLSTGLALVLFIADTFGGGTPILTTLGSDPNVSSRAGYLGAAADLFLRSPLLGVGLGGFSATGLDTYPHNMVAEILSELGLVGFFVFASWCVLAVRGAARSPITMALLVGTFVYLLFSGSLASNVEFWLFSALAVARIPLGRAGAAEPAINAHRAHVGIAAS